VVGLTALASADLAGAPRDANRRLGDLTRSRPEAESAVSRVGLRRGSAAAPRGHAAPVVVADTRRRWNSRLLRGGSCGSGCRAGRVGAPWRRLTLLAGRCVRAVRAVVSERVLNRIGKRLPLHHIVADFGSRRACVRGLLTLYRYSEAFFKKPLASRCRRDSPTCPFWLSATFLSNGRQQSAVLRHWGGGKARRVALAKDKLEWGGKRHSFHHSKTQTEFQEDNLQNAGSPCRQ